MATKAAPGELIEKVVKIRRCAAVVKGGRRFSFTALVVMGDGQPHSMGRRNSACSPSIYSVAGTGSRSAW